MGVIYKENRNLNFKLNVYMVVDIKGMKIKVMIFLRVFS